MKDENGDAHAYTLFISPFDEEIKTEQLPKKKEKVIIDPAGSKDSVGGVSSAIFDDSAVCLFA